MWLGTILRTPTRIGTLLLVVMTVGACGSARDGASGRAEAVGSFFPIAATLRALGGTTIAVRDLTPPGVEPHDLELTSDQVDAILDAELVVVMGQGFQPGVERAAKNRTGATIELLNRLHAGSDPHVWLDPVLMGRVVRLIAPAVETTFPGQRAAVRQRRAAIEATLASLDAEYRTGLDACDRDTLVTAHDSFGRLAHRYGLIQEPIAGIDPAQEPDPRRVAELADLVDRQQITTVFTEELVSPRVAQTLAREAGVKTAVLDPIESPPNGTATFGAYVTAMRTNLAVLRKALGCA